MPKRVKKKAKKAEKKAEVIGLRNHVKIFSKKLFNISLGAQPEELFRDFILFTIQQFMLPKKKPIFPFKKYNEQQRKDFYLLFTLFVKMMNEGIHAQGWYDLLGKTAEEEEMLNARLSQFFTPESIVNFMVESTILKQKDQSTVSDPTAGSSRFLIAHKAKISKQNKNSYYFAIDISELAFLMSVVNFLFHGLEGEIVHGDSLAMEFYKGYKTIKIFGLPPVAAVEISEKDSQFKKFKYEASE